MKVFISYSTKDLKLVQLIEKSLEPQHKVFYWDKDKKAGDDVWKTINHWIDTCDIFLVVITHNAVSHGMSIGKEIGWVETTDKRIIAFIGEEVSVSELPFLKNIAYIRVNPYDTVGAIERLKRDVSALELEKKQRESSQGLLFLVAVLVLLWLSSK